MEHFGHKPKPGKVVSSSPLLTAIKHIVTVNFSGINRALHYVPYIFLLISNKCNKLWTSSSCRNT
jgi:hypothetical protein